MVLWTNHYGFNNWIGDAGVSHPLDNKTRADAPGCILAWNRKGERCQWRELQGFGHILFDEGPFVIMVAVEVLDLNKVGGTIALRVEGECEVAISTEVGERIQIVYRVGPAGRKRRVEGRCEW